MLRVIGDCGDHATRIENRIGEPAANPYLYMASQVYAGLDGLAQRLRAPAATESPYGSQSERLPTRLPEALQALREDDALVAGLGADFVAYFAQVKASEIARYEAAQDKDDFQRREYFSRF
jgi:glutamine synthetase